MLRLISLVIFLVMLAAMFLLLPGRNYRRKFSAKVPQDHLPPFKFRDPAIAKMAELARATGATMMAGPSAPVARTAKTTAPTNGKQVATPTVPFPVASLRRVRQAFQTPSLAPGQNVSAIEIPAAGGFLRFIEIQVVGTTAGNAATVAFQPDAPFNALQNVEFLPPSGDPPIVPISGYQLYLWNKYGFFSQSPPWADPRMDPFISTTPGAGATGGSFAFSLRLPFEIDPQSGYCAITNSAANKSYLLNFNIAASATIYSTAPTNPPGIVVTGWMYYWDEPSGQTRQGTNQRTGPDGLGSFSQIRLDTPPVTPGDKYVKVNNAGPVLRQLIVCLRVAAGARTNADLPALWDFVFNTRDRFLIADNQLVSDIAEEFGYQGLSAVGTNYDTARGLDTGVRVFPYFNAFGGISPINPRSQYQVTADATLTQVRATSFGANASTFEIHTNLIRPTSAASLFPNDRV